MSLRRIRDDVRFELDYEDETPFGSGLGGGADRALMSACAAIVRPGQPRNMRLVVKSSKKLLADAFGGALSSRYSRSGVLREECLYPDPERVRPRALSVTRERRVVATIELDRAVVRELAPWISEFQRGSRRPSSGVGSALYDAFEAAGALGGEAIEPEPPAEADVVLVGHATALLGRKDRVLVDPFSLPTSPSFPEQYQPLRIADLSQLAGVLVTHSHPDHFDPATLLRLGADTPIYVPAVERESLLSVDMALRLEQMGFSHVKRVRPGDVLEIGSTTVRAFPLLGEQPTTGERLHPEVRNVGCTYLFESEGRRVFLIADSGRDADGDVRDLAAEVRRQHGDVDVLLGGYRGFALYPIHYLFSSVARYLLFVPESEWCVRQLCMNDADAMLDTAERAGARYAAPYADGGAPWYWELGLGPRLDGQGTHRRHVDPPPEDVASHAAERSSSIDESIASPVEVVVLRPGQSLRLGDDGSTQIESGPHQRWPYDLPRWHQLNVALVRHDGSALASARAVFQKLAPALESWRADGRLSRFFFMRKPPDLRLRFLGAASLGSELEALLEALRAEGAIEHGAASVYEPETERFGGERAMDAVHAWFDADTRGWMRLDQLRASGADVVEPERLTSAIAGDLVAAMLSDRAEAIAVWRAHAAAAGAGEDAGSAEFVAADLATLTAATSAEARAVLDGYRQANRALADELARLWSSGELRSGLRSVLATLILFHLHRHGLDAAGHARVATAMIRALGGE